MIRSPYLSQLSGADVWLKLENWQPTGSFKIRGALSKLSRLTEAQRQQGIVAASAGNHALGVAYAAEKLGGFSTDIFVPGTAPKAKIDKLAYYPVTLHKAGDTYEDAHQAAANFAAETGALEISAYDDVDVVAGQASVGLEIFQQRPQADVVLVPIGGGGLMAGIATVAKAFSPTCRVIGVQPEASPAALLSLQQGQAIDPYDHEPTLADGLAGGFGAVPFALAHDKIDEIVLSSETNDAAGYLHAAAPASTGCGGIWGDCDCAAAHQHRRFDGADGGVCAFWRQSGNGRSPSHPSRIQLNFATNYTNYRKNSRKFVLIRCQSS